MPVYEAGEVEEQLFIAMRYVRGNDLRTLISNEGPLGPDRTVACSGRSRRRSTPLIAGASSTAT